MKTKFLICALVLIVGFTSCTSTYYVTGQGSPHRHLGYKKDYDDNYQNRRGYYPRGDWRYRGSPNNLRYRGW